MRFLRTLFWVVVIVSLAIFAAGNWNDVTLNLWGNLQADVKLPILLLLLFLIGFLPTYFVMRGKLWNLRRKLAADRAVIPPTPAPQASEYEEPEALA